MEDLTSSFSKLNTSHFERSKNIIIFGLPESEHQSDLETLNGLLTTLFQGPHFLNISNYKRIQSRNPDAHNPLIVTFSSKNECGNVLRLARLRKIKDIFFQKDLSKKSRLEIKQLLLECREKNFKNTDQNFRYFVGKKLAIYKKRIC
jgi:hypothetical protein